VVYANAALMLLAHVAWDKYALPAIAVLWLLKSREQAGQPRGWRE
jgi:hypothetical protein